MPHHARNCGNVQRDEFLASETPDGKLTLIQADRYSSSVRPFTRPEATSSFADALATASFRTAAHDAFHQPSGQFNVRSAKVQGPW
jgi:hypothetical protein